MSDKEQDPLNGDKKEFNFTLSFKNFRFDVGIVSEKGENNRLQVHLDVVNKNDEPKKTTENSCSCNGSDESYSCCDSDDKY